MWYVNYISIKILNTHTHIEVLEKINLPNKTFNHESTCSGSTGESWKTKYSNHDCSLKTKAVEQNSVLSLLSHKSLTPQEE